MARPERFELPTTKFVAWYSIQLSYGREEAELLGSTRFSSTPDVERGCVSNDSEPLKLRYAHADRAKKILLAEREGFEPSIELLTLYSLSRGAPSASRAPLRNIASVVPLTQL
jgi:hypothetical protein